MAKAPRPGKVKTRLSPPLTLEQSAALNICFLRDTTQNIADVSVTPGGFALIPQRGEGFGERLLAAAEDILACGFGAVCLIDSDSPTVPASALRLAVDVLNQPGDRIAIGGSSDGGYYLIGLKRAHPEPFANIPWSTSTVYTETTSAIAARGIELVELPLWYDVDDGKTLDLLREELLGEKPPPFAEARGYSASHSRKFLHDLLGGDQ
jgi:glycosyltransferase A (GT-A) superfamily protein (DUF2064 family)